MSGGEREMRYPFCLFVQVVDDEIQRKSEKVKTFIVNI